MNLVRREALLENFQQTPPIQWLMASWLKYKPPTKVKSKPVRRKGGSGFRDMARETKGQTDMEALKEMGLLRVGQTIKG